MDTFWTQLSGLNYKYTCIVSLCVIAVLTLYMASKTAVNGDAPIDYENGKSSLNFYLSGGKDTTCLNVTIDGAVYASNKYYGMGFESTCAAIEKIVKPDDAYQLRMYYLALWGVILFLFIGLIGKELANWQGALLTLWLSFLSPFFLGNVFWNTKDIPHALGYAIAIYYMVRFYKHLPEITLSNAVGVTIGIVIGLSIRIGGLLGICYWGLFLLLSFLKPRMRQLFVKKEWISIIKICCVGIGVAVLGLLLGLLAYPNFLVHGFSHVMESFQVMSQFSLNTPFVFEGKQIFSKELPWYYLPKIFFITTPILHIVLMMIAIPVLIIRRKKIGVFNILLLLFTVIFPFVYIIATDAVVYNGWRHALFAYVALPPLLAIIVVNLIGMAEKVPVKMILTMVLIIPMIYLLVWNIKNAPYQLTYYNQFVGGVKGAYTRYDFDLAHFAAPAAAKKLFKELSPQDYSEEKPLKIAITNGLVSKFMHIPKEWEGKVTVEDISYKGYASKECDYAILSLQFSKPVMRSTFFPPEGTIMTEKVDGMPIACVVDRREGKDYKGIKSVMENNMEEGLKLLKEAYEYDPNNFSMYYYLGYAWYRSGNNAEAVKILNSYNRYYPQDKDAHRLLGYVYYADKKHNDALKAFNVAFAQTPSDMEVAYMIGLCYYQSQNFAEAERFLTQVVNQNPAFAQGKELLNAVRATKK
ncbi:MAG: tetratricopeptide repeat protein [Bacteroidales bacterium]|nr:tetratricopeptide repeat protein [Bacteroidales bacterium]